MACWRTKAAISQKRVKIGLEDNLPWTAYRNTLTLFRTVPSPTSYGLPFHKIGVHNPHSKVQSNILGNRVLIEEYYAWRACRNSPTLFRAVYHRNKSIKFWKSSRGRTQGVPLNFQGNHIQGALRDHLCDSTAFLFLLPSSKEHFKDLDQTI